MGAGQVLQSMGGVACVVAVLATAACGSSGTTSSYSPRTTPTAPNVNVPFTATDTVVGPGNTATAGHMVLGSYTGWLYDPDTTDHHGKQFDSNSNFGFILG